MVVIFGWGDGRTQDLGEVAPTICPNCHNNVFLHEIKSESQFSLYFIPLGSYKTNEYLACPICKSGLQIQPQHRPAVSNMRAATAVYRRGRVTEEGYRGTVAQFWAEIGVSPSGEQVLQSSGSVPPPAAVGAAQNEPKLADQLAGLGKLRDDGVLTDDEFAAAKRRILGS